MCHSARTARHFPAPAVAEVCRPIRRCEALLGRSGLWFVRWQATPPQGGARLDEHIPAPPAPWAAGLGRSRASHHGRGLRSGGRDRGACSRPRLPLAKSGRRTAIGSRGQGAASHVGPGIGVRPIQAAALPRRTRDVRAPRDASLISPRYGAALAVGGARCAPNHAERMTTDHPAGEDAPSVFWQTDTTRCSGPAASISTLIRSGHTPVERKRSRTCRTTFLEGG